MEEVISSSLEGFVFEKNLNSRRSKCKKVKVWESPFIPSHLTFKKVSNFTQFHSINQIYLFIITFQNLEFWDVTNLPPLEAWLRFHQNSYTSSILLTVSVFSDLQDNSLSGLFR